MGSNNMKNNLVRTASILMAALFVLLIPGCPAPIQPMAPAQGGVQISISSGADAARTLKPQTPHQIDRFVLRFSGPGSIADIDVTVANPQAITVYLPDGAWTITADGYTTGITDPIASGSSMVTVSGAISATTILVSLLDITKEGTLLLKTAAEDGITFDVFTIWKYAEDGSRTDKQDLAGNIPLANTPYTLNAGQYWMEFTAVTVDRIEFTDADVVYIYPYQETEWPIAKRDNQFEITITGITDETGMAAVHIYETGTDITGSSLASGNMMVDAENELFPLKNTDDESFFFAGNYCITLNFVDSGNTYVYTAGKTFSELGITAEADYDALPRYYLPGDVTIAFEKFVPEYVTVTFAPTGADPVAPVDLFFGNTVGTLFPTSAREGHTLAGWFTDDGTFANPFTDTTPVTADITIYAKWDPIPYTVTFEPNGGSAVNPVTVLYGNAIGTLPPTPTQDGFTLVGWFTDDGTFTNPFTKSTVITQDITVYAQWAAVTPDLTYTLINGGTAYSVGQGFGTNGDVIIPASYNSLPVTEIASNGFIDNIYITSVLIPDTVTSIENNAFLRCTGLTSVTIPDSITSIGESAFTGSHLTSIHLPNSVTSIGASAFNGCAYLTSVTLPDSITTIEMNTFAYCTSLTSITIPNSVTSIKDSAFSGTRFTEIIIPDSVTSLGSFLFQNSTMLASITIGNQIPLIPYGAFTGCASLTSIILPDSVTSIDSNAFYGCTSLTEVTFSDNITSIGAQAFEKCSSLTEIAIPDSVMSIGQWAFLDCSNITSITIGAGVTTINSAAFQNCISLTSIIIPDTVTTLEIQAFEGCTSLTSAVISSNVTVLNNNRFAGCTSLISVTFRNSNSNLGSTGNIGFIDEPKNAALKALYENPTYGGAGTYIRNGDTWTKEGAPPPGTLGLAFTPIGSPATAYSVSRGTVTGGDVVIPAMGNDGANGFLPVKEIAASGFLNFTGLTGITIPDSVTAIGANAFDGCTGLTEITFPDTLETIGDSAFASCTGLTELLIPDSVTSIGAGAFRFCAAIESITIGSGITSLQTFTFESCNALTSITFKNSGVDLGNAVVFMDTANNNQITALYIQPYPYGEAGTYVLVGNTWQKTGGSLAFTLIGTTAYSVSAGTVTSGNVVIPNMYNGLPVTEIAANGFDGLTVLTGITIPNSITSIGDSAFYGCSNLTSITIPASVQTMGTSAFEYCSQLQTVTINASLTSISNTAFANCTKLGSITLPTSVTSIGQSAFYGCTSLTSIAIPNGVTSIGASAFEYAAVTNVIMGSGVTTFGANVFPGVLNATSSTLQTVYLGLNAASRAGTYTRTAGQDDWKKLGTPPSVQIIAAVPTTSAAPGTIAFTVYWTVNTPTNANGTALIMGLQSGNQSLGLFTKTATGWENTTGSGTASDPYVTTSGSSTIAQNAPITITLYNDTIDNTSGATLQSTDTEDPATAYTETSPLVVNIANTATADTGNGIIGTTSRTTLATTFGWIARRYSDIKIVVWGENITAAGLTIDSAKRIIIEPAPDQPAKITMTDSSGLDTFTIAGNLTIQGSGAGILTLGGISTSNLSMLSVSNGGNLTMNAGAVISGYTLTISANYDRAVVVQSGGTFTMTGGTIENNASIVSNGIILLNGGTFKMSGGTIQGNTAPDGGAVYMSGAIFTMTGGTIQGNTADRGGGVYMYSGTFTMSNGTIGSNTASGNGGGVYVLYGTLTMTGGIIEKNKAVNGGGVYVDIDTDSTNTGNFIMNGTAEIKENETTTSGNGGGVYNKGTFSMGSVTGSTPSIAGNISSGLGGGLYNEGIFTMGIPNVITTPDFDPVITANRASQGGGVYSRATLSPKKSYFHTGTVSGNQATGTDNTGAFLGSQLFSASGNINNLNLNTGTDNRVNTAIISGVIQP